SPNPWANGGCEHRLDEWRLVRSNPAFAKKRRDRPPFNSSSCPCALEYAAVPADEGSQLRVNLDELERRTTVCPQRRPSILRVVPEGIDCRRPPRVAPFTGEMPGNRFRPCRSLVEVQN